MKNSSITLRCALLLLLVFGGAQFLQAYDFEVDGIYYNEVYNPVGKRAMVTYKVLIEDEEEEEDQKGLRGSESGYSGDITIPTTVTYKGTTYRVNSIGKCAFQNCRELTSVSIPSSVVTINDDAFRRSGLTSITIPSTVTTIGKRLFFGL